MLTLFLIALAMSMDSFAVGAVYGIRKIRMPLVSLGVIALFTACSVAIAVWIGGEASERLSPNVASMLGGGMLVAIGVVTLLERVIVQRSAREAQTLAMADAVTTPDVLPKWHSLVKRLWSSPRLLGHPTDADVDASRSISSGEACFLGIAVSLDSFAGGLGVRMLGYPPWRTIVMFAIASSAFVGIGLQAGHLLRSRSIMTRLTWAPGAVLIVIGLVRIFNA